MNPGPPSRRPRVAPPSTDSLAHRRDLAHLARRALVASPEATRALTAYLVLLRAVEAR